MFLLKNGNGLMAINNYEGERVYMARKRLRALTKAFNLEDDYSEELERAKACLKKGDVIGCNSALDSMNLD